MSGLQAGLTREEQKGLPTFCPGELVPVKAPDTSKSLAYPEDETHCQGTHGCEPLPLCLKVRVFEFILLSKLLPTGVVTNKRHWPRVWLVSILSVEVDLLHLDQRAEHPSPFLVSANEVCCLLLPLWSM